MRRGEAVPAREGTQRVAGPSMGRAYLAPLPAGYAGHFGPGVKALALAPYHVTGVSEPHAET